MVRSSPERDFDAAMNAAERMDARGDGSAKIHAYTEIIEKFPGRFEPYFRRSFAKLPSERSGAMEDISTAIAMNPAEPACLFFRGMWRLESGSYKEALADLDQVIALECGLGSDYYLTAARFLRLLAAISLGDFDRHETELALIPSKYDFFVAGRLWTMADVRRCVATRSRPSL